MSAYTTLNITRSKAKMLLLNELFGGAIDDGLERFIDDLLEPRLYNCNIVSDDCENDDCMI